MVILIQAEVTPSNHGYIALDSWTESPSPSITGAYVIPLDYVFARPTWARAHEPIATAEEKQEASENSSRLFSTFSAFICLIGTRAVAPRLITVASHFVHRQNK
jgi:hypothetical protein